MRVLINYLYQYYPFTTASYVEDILRADKRFDVFRIGENRIPCADLIINIEPCGFVIAYPGKKSCYWEIDNHIHKGEHYDKYDRVNNVFIAQEYYKKYYPKEKTEVLPLGADPEKHKLYPDEPLKYDIGFIGNNTYYTRKRLLERLSSEFNVFIGSAKPGEEYSRKLSQCKMVFNCSMNHDVNMRVFEGISIGRLLLTDKIKYQDKLFKDKEHFVTYKGWEDLKSKVHYYLRHDKERNKIALTGANYIRAKHTYRHRLEQILKTMGFY